MTISLSDAGKRFNRDWIFRHFTYDFDSGKSYAITGHNGSGKSTLLQVIAGAIALSEGSISYEDKTTSFVAAPDSIHTHLSIAAPYLELIEEMTLLEFLKFHSEFKPFLPGFNAQNIAEAVQLKSAENKQIRYYSSGMKQRVKLAQAIFSATPVVLLDEPCTNLDSDGIDLYHRLITQHCKDRLVIVSSNDETEYSFCEKRLKMNELI